MVKIEIDDRQVQAALQRVMDISRNPRPVLKEVGSAVADSTRMRFIEQKAPDGTPWKPLKALTISRRRKKGKDAKALLDTGRLRNSITYLVGGDFVEVGTSVKYAPTHQFGARMGQYGRYYQLSRLKYGEKDFRRYAGMRKGHPIPWGNIPARPFLGLSEEDKQEVLSICADAYRAAWNGIV